MIKGGGAALTREKIAAAKARSSFASPITAKWSRSWARFRYQSKLFPWRAPLFRRAQPAWRHAVWREGVVTDNGNIILDVHGLQIDDPKALESEINNLTGVVCNGIFAHRPADVLLISTPGGVVRIL